MRTTTRKLFNGSQLLETSDAQFSVPVTLLVGTNQFQVVSTDAAGNVSATAALVDIEYTVNPTPTPTPCPTPSPSPSASPVIPLPPDPAQVAPAVTSGSSGANFDAYSFLFQGNNPVQTGVQTGAIVAERASLIRGRLLTRL